MRIQEKRMKAVGEYRGNSTISYCDCGCTVVKGNCEIWASGCKTHPEEKIMGIKGVREHWTWNIVHTNVF